MLALHLTDELLDLGWVATLGLLTPTGQRHDVTPRTEGLLADSSRNHQYFLRVVQLVLLDPLHQTVCH